MTEQEIAELVKRLAAVASYLEQAGSSSIEMQVNAHRAEAVRFGVEAIASLSASLALCERRAEEAESRVTFYESELVKTAMALAKITDELRALREAGK